MPRTTWHCFFRSLIRHEENAVHEVKFNKQGPAASHVIASATKQGEAWSKTFYSKLLKRIKKVIPYQVLHLRT